MLRKPDSAMRKIFVFTLIGFLASCQQESPSVNANEVKSTQTDGNDLQNKAASVVPTHQIEIPVSGMSCEMACGGAIRKELLGTQAVNRVQFDFQMARDTNIAIVKFNAKEISQEKIVDLIQHINQGQFTTGKIQIKELDHVSEVEKGNVQSQGSLLLPTEFPKVEIPSIIDILRSIIIH